MIVGVGVAVLVEDAVFVGVPVGVGAAGDGAFDSPGQVGEPEADQEPACEASPARLQFLDV